MNFVKRLKKYQKPVLRYDGRKNVEPARMVRGLTFGYPINTDMIIKRN